MLTRLLSHHILANLAFVLVLAVGTVAYLDLPRQQDPSVNFNWVQITTIVPGASATDVEERVTDVLEEGIEKIADVKFTSSSSREGLSSILVRFRDLPETDFERRLSDLRRELQNRESELPAQAERPDVLEVTSANAFPSAIVLAVGSGDDESLRRQAKLAEEDLERFARVDRVDAIGLTDPELKVLFGPQRLLGLGISPSTLADTVDAYFRDLAAGTVTLGEQAWLVRLTGTDNDPSYLANLPILTNSGEIPLRSVAEVTRGRERPQELVLYDGQPSVMLAVFKRDDANILDLVTEIKGYIQTLNARSETRTGVRLLLLDDQTAVTRNALKVMEANALLGLTLVLLMTWVFLGFRLAALTTLGIPFVLAGTFFFLHSIGQTLNVIVLLGVVMSLGMLVDDAIVVVESIHVRMRRGTEALQAAAEALREVAAPVTASVLTTIAAFLPLMLLPGVLGKFLQVAPLVVTVALLLSLVEAYWMLPTHVVAAGTPRYRHSIWQRAREQMTTWLRLSYGKALIRALRQPSIALATLILLVAGAITAVALGLVRVELFATDVARLFYVNIEMPPASRLEQTVATARRIEEAVLTNIRPDELRGSAAYAGMRFTEREPLYGDQHGQVLISLRPQTPGGRTVDEIIDDMRDATRTVTGPSNVSFLRVIQGAPPTSKPISIKVRGDDPNSIRAAANSVSAVLRSIPAVSDVSDDDTEGRLQLSMRLNGDAIVRAGLNPATVARDLRLLADGEVVANMRDRGERLDVRVQAAQSSLSEIDDFLRHTIGLSDGSSIFLRQLVDFSTERGEGNIRHYNFRRAITVEANLDKSKLDTLAAIRVFQAKWDPELGQKFQNVELDFTGELDDIQESLDAMAALFLVGVGLIYLILGTQFHSYLQPVVVLATIPMAFTGVVVGLLVSGNPLSLYTLYGMIALTGIGVNSAIVLISAVNDRRREGMGLMHATVYAARRRVVPILITSLTTIGGLFSLAAGLGGKSLIWGPLATSIVWGLAVSTALTLFVIPLLYAIIARRVPVASHGAGASLEPYEQFGFKSLRGLLKARPSDWRAALHAIEASPEIAPLYREGTELLRQRRYEPAIRVLEEAARRAPDNGVLQTAAAQALIEYMARRLGWDVGYMERARRFLARAERLLPEEPRVEALKRAYADLEPGDSGGDGSTTGRPS